MNSHTINCIGTDCVERVWTTSHGGCLTSDLADAALFGSAEAAEEAAREVLGAPYAPFPWIVRAA